MIVQINKIKKCENVILDFKMLVYLSLNTGEYMKDHTFELQRKISRHD